MGARNRGWLSGLTMPMMSIGVLLVYTMGSWLPWHYTAAICTLVPLCLLAALSPYFDSPYWYFSIGKEKNAHQAIEQFRGPATNVVSEIFTIQQHVESSQSEEDISFFTAVVKVFTEKKYFKPFFILNFLFFLMIFSGKFTIDFYAVDFFQKTGTSINEYISAVILAFIHLVGSLLFIALVKKLSRKLLLSISSLVMGISLAITGAWMYFSPIQTMDWFPIISMLIYMLAAPLGLCSIPFLYIAEFFPSELRSVLAGHHGLVWFYSAACFGAILLTLSYVPETKDKSLTVITDKFAKLRKTVRASPWVTPLPSPSVNSVRKFQYKSQMFTQ